MEYIELKPEDRLQEGDEYFPPSTSSMSKEWHPIKGWAGYTVGYFMDLMDRYVEKIRRPIQGQATSQAICVCPARQFLISGHNPDCPEKR